MGATATFLKAWSFDPVLGCGLVLAAAAYLWAVHQVGLRQPQRPWPRRYTVSFLAALVCAYVVLLGPIGQYDDVFFWAHMVQHIALMMVIAPLLLLGAPVLLLLRVSSRRQRRRVLTPLLRSDLADPASGGVAHLRGRVGRHALLTVLRVRARAPTRAQVPRTSPVPGSGSSTTTRCYR